MSGPEPEKIRSSLSNPQVITAIIGGIVTLVAALVGILPNVLNGPSEASAVVIVTPTLPLTTLPFTEPTLLPTNVPSGVSATAVVPSAEAIAFVPTATSIRATMTPSQPANLILIWDDVSFSAVNVGGATLSLVGVTFVSRNGNWDARAWGPSLYNNVPAQSCLRLRESTAGQRNPPGECNDLYGLILVGTPAIFWRSVDSFDVMRDGSIMASCLVLAGRCEVLLS